jgi:phenylpyruvate tautomerase PptA (4-oxalocrotonate tautomerase family)
MSLISSVSVLTFRMTRIILNVDDGRQLVEKFPQLPDRSSRRLRGDLGMPMIDVYATAGTFADSHALAGDLATAVMRWEQVADLALFRDNTAAFVHELPADSIANVNGESNCVRVQVLTPVGVLDRDQQLGVVKELTEIVAAAAGAPSLVERTWVLLTESPEGGWGVAGHAHTGADLAAAARAEMAAAAQQQGAGA